MALHLVDADGRVVGPVAVDEHGLHRVTVRGREHVASGPEPLATLVAPLQVRASMDATLESPDGGTQSAQVLVRVARSEGATFQVAFRVEVHAEDAHAVSPWRDDWMEVALEDVRAALRPWAVRQCFFCRWSDYPPRGGAGSLHCFVATPEPYLRAAMARDSNTRQRGAFDQVSAPGVSEFHRCERFSIRPAGLGARG
jgi:hypothetical protein